MDPLDAPAYTRVSIPLGWLPPGKAWQRLMAYPMGVKSLFIGYLGGIVLSLLYDLLQWILHGVPAPQGPIPIYFQMAVVSQMMVIVTLWLIPMVGYPLAMVILGLDILYHWIMTDLQPGSMGFAFLVVEGLYLLYFLFTIPLLQYRLLDAQQATNAADAPPPDESEAPPH